MGVYKRGNTYWYEFTFSGRRIRESAKTHSKTIAKKAEQKRRRELEESFSGIAEDNRSLRVQSVSQATASYLNGYEADHAAKSVRWVRQTLAHVDRLLGRKLVSDLTEDVMRTFVATRKSEAASGREINMEVGNLSRAVGRKWSDAWPGLRKQRERHDVGRALSPEEESRLRDAVAKCESDSARTAVYIALNTGMRADEIRSLSWAQVDLEAGVLAVGRSKTEGGSGRRVPINADLRAVLEAHRDWYRGRFGEARSDWYLFPAGQRGRAGRPGQQEDPSRPAGSIRKSWDTIRTRAKVDCRFHDLRHTVATKMAEAGVAESTMIAILGWMSRAMLERYSHIRMAAKRDAVEALNVHNSQALPTESPTVVEDQAVQ